MMLFLAIIPLISLTSCKDDDDDNVIPPQAEVMVVHTSPNAPGVDLLVDNIKVNNAALTFPSNTGYLDVNAGTRNFKVNVAGNSTTALK